MAVSTDPEAATEPNSTRHVRRWYALSAVKPWLVTLASAYAKTGRGGGQEKATMGINDENPRIGPHWRLAVGELPIGSGQSQPHWSGRKTIGHFSVRTLF